MTADKKDQHCELVSSCLSSQPVRILTENITNS